MIISRTPFRLPLGGGGTDLPSYYSQYGGFFVSGALDKFMYIALNKRFENSIRVSYSKTEIVDIADQVQHPLIREALKMVGIERGIEIVSIADVPASTGLGSSASFCVGLLNALHTYLRERKSMHEIAEEACEIAMQRLKEPSGKQDEYAASFGGVCAYEIDRNGLVEITPMRLSTNTLAELESSLLMFYTGITRNSSEILSKQQTVISEQDEDTIERMHRIKQIGLEIRKVLEVGDLHRFGELLHEHWIAKRGVTDLMTSSQIDKWYQIGRKNGALGGKIIGAGGGGFLLFYCDNNREHLRKAMLEQGLIEHRFKFEFDGSKIIYNV